MKPGARPCFFVDSLPDIPDTECRELLRSIEINAGLSDIFVWLTQLRIAPYSYDFIDNQCRKSPEYIIENLPPLRVNSHYLLAFHTNEFMENSFITGRYCEPINSPVNLYMKDMYIEYRIEAKGTNAELWCKLKGFYNTDIFSHGFFFIFSVVNKIMMTKQMKNIKRLAELSAAGKVEVKRYDLKDYFIKSGLHWWVFCRRHNCKKLFQ
jgi:hypothetical protein